MLDKNRMNEACDTVNQTFFTKRFQHLDRKKGVHLLKQAESPGTPPPNCKHQILSLY